MKKILLSVSLIALSVLAIFQATSAALQETVKVAGTSFGVSSDVTGGIVDTNTALKLFANLEGTASGSNLVDSVAGPSFSNMTTSWTDNYLVKVHNKSASPMDLIAMSEYINDPDTLRDDIYVEIVEWDDVNSNGQLDDGEEGASHGYDTILRLKNDTFNLGSIAANQTKGFAFKFDGSGLSEANQSMNAVYDFLIKGVTP